MGWRVLTCVAVLVTLFAAQGASAAPTVEVMSAQGQTATKQAKIVIGLVGAGGDVLAAENWLDKLTIDGADVRVAGLALNGGLQAMGTIIWPTGGPLPGNHTVKVTVKLKSGGTATMNVTTIMFVD